MSELSPFGKELRKIRIDKGLRLFDLATRLGISTAFLSAIETGRKPIPDGFVVKISGAIDLSLGELKELRAAAEKTKREIRLDKLKDEDRQLVAAFARRIDELPEELIEQLRKKVLESRFGEEPFKRNRRGLLVPARSAAWLRQYANKVRSVFGCDRRFDFPIIEIIEHQLHKLFPHFVFDVRGMSEIGRDEGRVPIGQCRLILREDVYVAACHGDGRARFTASHEFLHFLLHREISFARARDDSDKIYCDSEWQADEFAGALLMSTNHVNSFQSSEDAATKCIVSRHAASVMWSKYVKAGVINPQAAFL
ncbi:MAG: XRE family transcriptional regulator [Methylocystis sp.]